MERFNGKHCLVILPFLFCFGLPLAYAVQSETRASECQPPGNPTSVSGPIEQDTLWKLLGSPFVVKGDVSIARGVQLEIEPGVEVRFDGAYSMSVFGQLLAQGRPRCQITFTSNQANPAQGDWQGITFFDDSTATISEAVIEFSSVGVTVENASVTITHTVFRSNRRGLSLVSPVTGSLITANDITDNEFGILLETPFDFTNLGAFSTPPDSIFPSINNNSIFANAVYDLIVRGGTPSTTIQAENNWWGTLDHELIGLKILDSADDPSLPTVDFLPFLDGPDGNSIFPALPPELDPVGDQSVALGSTLVLELTATDPNDDVLTFSALPVPLPQNASFSAATGIFVFSPDEDQIGSFHLTFVASDGELTDVEGITITVEAVFGATELTGRLLDTNDFVEGIETPVVGATIAILNAGISTYSDLDGQFTLSDIPSAEEYVLDIDSTSALPAPDGSPYAGFRENIELIEDVNNVVPEPFLLPRIDLDSLTKVNPDEMTIVENPNIGVMIVIPPFTAMDEDGSFFDGFMSISEVPEGQAPQSLPPELDPGLLITIQPVGVTFDQPVAITFPNSTDELPVGTMVDIWSLDAGTGEFVVACEGTVNADGTITGALCISAADWHMALPVIGSLFGTGNNGSNLAANKAAVCTVLSQVELASGKLIEDHTLASYRARGQSNALRFVYNSTSADPQPIIAANATIPAVSAVPGLMSSSLTVGGIEQGLEVFTDTSGLSESVDEPVRQVVQVDAAMFETGRYPYQLTLTSHFAQSSVSGSFLGNVIVNNQQNSPIGAGWTLDGVSQLIVQPDGGILLVEGDGSSRSYMPPPTPMNGLRMVMYDIPSLAAVGNGFRGLDQGSFLVTTVDGSQAVSEYVMPTVNAPDTGFDQQAFYHLGPNGFIDPGSSALVPLGDDISIQPPGGNNLFGASFTGFVLVPDGGDVTFTVRVDDAFVLIVNGSSVLQHLGSCNFCTFSTVVANLPAGLVPITLHYGEQFIEADIVLQASGGGLPGGVIPQEFLLTDLPGGGTPGAFVSPPGDFATLVRNDDDTFSRTTKDGTVISFDAAGIHTSTVDRNGNTTAYAYDAEARLETITDPRGLVTTFSYGPAGLLDTVTDPVGRVTTFIHDENTDLVQIIDPDSTSRHFEYDSRHRLTSQTNKRGFTTTYDYNFAGRMVQGDRPDGSTRMLNPSQTVGLVDISSGLGTPDNPAPVTRPEDAVSVYTDGNGNATIVETDRFRAITKLTDALPEPRVTIIERNEDGDPTSITQPNGAITSFTYDDRGNLLTLNQEAIEAITAFTYETSFNQVTSILDAESHLTVINYDPNGNPIEIIDDAGTITKLEYEDPNCPGQVTRIISAFGFPEESTTEFEYDPDTCNLTLVRDPLLHETASTYDAAGNVDTVLDAEGKLTRFIYDISTNRLIQVVDADLQTTTYVYDEEGNLTSVRDANMHETEFAYDEMNRLEIMSDPLRATETYAYNGNGNLRFLTDRNSQQLEFQYDEVNRLISKILPGNLVTTYTYTLLDNLGSAVDPDSALTFEYDDVGRLTMASTAGSPTQPVVVIDYEYDKVGNRTAMTDSLTGTTVYTYDNLSRLDEITDPSSLVIDFEYDSLSRHTITARPNGTRTTYAYDAASQLQQISHELSDIPFARFDYVYDGVGNRETVDVIRTAFSVAPQRDYLYDNLHRLEQATRPQEPPELDETFEYDALGNRLRRDGQLADSQFDAANRLLNDTIFTYQYDDNGNLVEKTHIARAATTLYTHDAENRLIQIVFPDGSIAEYRYDSLGRRIEKNVLGSVVRYVYDLEDVVVEFDGVNALLARYTHGPGIDDPLKVERGGEVHYYHEDGLGSIVDLSDSAGLVVQSYLYDSFGNIVDVVASFPNPYTYTGRQLDVESGLFFYRARSYDPVAGRFVQQDPLGFVDSLNLYSYVINNPISYIDPYGLLKREGGLGYSADDFEAFARRLKEGIQAKNPDLSDWEAAAIADSIALETRFFFEATKLQGLVDRAEKERNKKKKERLEEKIEDLIKKIHDRVNKKR